MNKLEHKIIIEPLKKDGWRQMLAKVDEEIGRKKVVFSKQEAIKDDLYD